MEPWQLIPYDDQRLYARSFQVGDTALVTCRQSYLYGKKVLVCNVKDSGVDVVGPEMVTTVRLNFCGSREP